MHPSLEAVALVPALVIFYALVVKPRGSRAVAATAGIALIFASFFTTLQPLATHTFLWAHLLQNVVLAEWAPALLVLAIPRDRARDVRIPMLPALALWLATYFVWHLPWVYDAALRRQHWLLHIEHVTYLIAGVALWWPIVRGAQNAGAKALYLFAAFVLASPLGLVLALIPKPVYDFYAHAPRTWGPRPLADQQIAGVTMALEQAAVFFAVFALYLSRFLQEEQRDPELFRGSQPSGEMTARYAARDAGFDARSNTEPGLPP
jgi:cytochrome c oxidase assembly factor CtaG